MALFLVHCPHAFDAMVTENMFGDILSDLAAGLIGGMGMAPSADLGDDYGLFQPSCGAAPTVAGPGIANPIATILSVAMMLAWLDHPETIRGARLIERAVGTMLADPAHRAVDLGGKTSATRMGDPVCAALSGKSCASLFPCFPPLPHVPPPMLHGAISSMDAISAVGKSSAASRVPKPTSKTAR